MKQFALLFALAAPVFGAANLVGLWHLDQGSGQVAIDSSGFGNHGQLGSTTVADPNDPVWVAGRFGGALHFNGVDQFVRIPDSASLSTTGSITVEAWIKVDATPNVEYPIVAKWNDLGANNLRSYALALYNRQLRFDVSTNGVFGGGCTFGTLSQSCSNSSLVISAVAVPLGKWTHVAGVFDSSTGRLQVFINGSPDTSTIAPWHNIFDTGEPLLIGAGDYGGFPPLGRKVLQGAIDEARLWKRALTNAEILSSAQAGLRGLWHLNNSGADDSGFTNDLTLGGGAAFTSPGKFGSAALALDGVDDFASAPDAPSLAITGSITVEGWVKLNAFPPCATLPAGPCNTFAPVASKWNDIGGINDRGYFLAVMPDGSVRFDVSHSGFSCGVPATNVAGFSCASATSAILISTQKITLGAWNHVAGVFDSVAKTLRVYVNGVPSAVLPTLQSNVFASAQPLLVGAGDLAGSRKFSNGAIDELHLWARPLSPNELGFLAAAQTAAELHLPDTITQDTGDAGGVFESEWQVGKTTPVTVLEFFVPQNAGSQMTSIVERKPQTSTPNGTVAHLLGAVSGNSGLDALITGHTTNAKTLHLDIGLTPKAKLGVQIQWDPGAPWQ